MGILRCVGVKGQVHGARCLLTLIASHRHLAITIFAHRSTGRGGCIGKARASHAGDRELGSQSSQTNDLSSVSKCASALTLVRSCSDSMTRLIAE